LHSEILKVFNEFKSKENTPTEEKSKSSETSVADEIKKFKDLLDSGAITEEEFENTKKKLLNL